MFWGFSATVRCGRAAAEAAPAGKQKFRQRYDRRISFYMQDITADLFDLSRKILYYPSCLKGIIYKNLNKRDIQYMKRGGQCLIESIFESKWCELTTPPPHKMNPEKWGTFQVI